MCADVVPTKAFRDCYHLTFIENKNLFHPLPIIKKTTNYNCMPVNNFQCLVMYTVVFTTSAIVLLIMI